MAARKHMNLTSPTDLLVVGRHTWTSQAMADEDDVRIKSYFFDKEDKVV
jgi:hypothetical protein